MSGTSVWLSCIFHYKGYHIRECRRSVECLTESDQDSTAIVRLDKLPVEYPQSIADDQDSSAAVGLDKLPVDIFQCIMDFLPLDSAACLILSRKKLASAIGDRTLLALKAKRRERLNFLHTMQRDWKGRVICFPCEKLHPLKKCPSLVTGIGCAGEAPCTMADGIVELMACHILRWHHAHMIMRLNKQNPMDQNWIQALSGDIFDNDNVPWAHCRGRIANEHLLMKVEYRILLREKEDMHMCFPKICPHWNYCDRGQNLIRTLKRMLGCSMIHEATKPCVLCNSMIECSRCTTEFVISVLKCDWSLYDRAVYITVWKDLGSCETPFDTSWRTHCWRFQRSLPRESSVQFEPGSIRNAFEELGYPKLKDDGIASMWPLVSDVEYSRRLDESSKRDSTFSKIIRGETFNT